MKFELYWIFIKIWDIFEGWILDIKIMKKVHIHIYPIRFN